MTAPFDAERRIGAWIVAEAPTTAPDRILEVVMGRVDVTRQRRPLRLRVTRSWRAMSATRRIIAVGIAIIALGAGLALAGAIILRLAPGGSPALLIATPGLDGPEMPSQFTFVAIDADGQRRTVASVPSAPVDASLNGVPLAVSPDGRVAIPIYFNTDGGQAVSVVDLRDPTSVATIVDAHAGSVGRWLPDGRLVVQTEANGLAIWDPATGVTRPLSLGGATPWWVGGRVVVAADGSGFLATQSTPGGPVLGVVTLDGTFQPGAVPALDDGIGARRTRSDGARLWCAPDGDVVCPAGGGTIYAVGDGAAEPVWTNTDLTRRIDDMAWAKDGRRLWVLTEAVADLADVALLSVAPDGDVREVTHLALTGQGLADMQGVPVAEFSGMSADDTRLTIAAPKFGFGNLMADWLVDTRAGTTRKLDGSVVGWLGPSALTSPRARTKVLAETDADIRGDWSATLTKPLTGSDGSSLSAGPVPVAIGRTSINVTLDDGGFWTMVATASGPNTIDVTSDTDAFGCTPGSVGTYRWSVGRGRLTLDPVTEPCAARSALFLDALQQVLPPAGSSARTAHAGGTYLAPSFVWPFQVTIPASGDADVPESSARLVFMQGMTASEMNLVSIYDARAGVEDPCAPNGGTTVPIAPGLDGFRAYLDGLTSSGLEVGPFEDTEVGGRPALVTEVSFGDVCPGDTQSLFDETSDNGWYPMGDHVRVYLLAGDDGSHVAIVMGPVIADSPWMDELLASIRFAGAP